MTGTDWAGIVIFALFIAFALVMVFGKGDDGV